MLTRRVKPDDFVEKIIDCELPSVVKFYDNNCPLCNGLADPFERLAKKYIGKFKFFKINIKDDLDFCDRYLDGGIPTILVFLNTDTPILVDYPEEEDPISGYPFDYLDRWLYHFDLSYKSIKEKLNNE